MAVDKLKQLTGEMENAQNEHSWKAVIALNRWMRNREHSQHPGVDWSDIAEASYHAGAAYALRDARFKY